MFQTPSSPGLPYVHSIKSVEERDRGMYTCVARNVVGRSHAAAYLQVNTGQPLMISKSVSFSPHQIIVLIVVAKHYIEGQRNIDQTLVPYHVGNKIAS